MIPRVIHHVWVGGPLPDRLAGCVASWAHHHPDWDHRLWGDDDLGWIRHRDLYDAAADLVPADAVGQFRGDLARYDILACLGGLYVDCDTECLRPIDERLAAHEAWAAAEDDHWIGNTYLAATPGHPVMAALVAGIPASVAANRRRRPNRMTGPRYLTPIWRAHGAHVDPTALWYPYSYSHVKTGTVPDDVGGAYAVHRWDHTRQVMGVA